MVTNHRVVHPHIVIQEVSLDIFRQTGGWMNERTNGQTTDCQTDRQMDSRAVGRMLYVILMHTVWALQVVNVNNICPVSSPVVCPQMDKSTVDL